MIIAAKDKAEVVKAEAEKPAKAEAPTKTPAKKTSAKGEK